MEIEKTKEIVGKSLLRIKKLKEQRDEALKIIIKIFDNEKIRMVRENYDKGKIN
jgi:hypothetical protein